ncbi:MAG: choice-of-anchor D domain-containing protein [Candidatus Kapaibacterium sp.]
MKLFKIFILLLMPFAAFAQAPDIIIDFDPSYPQQPHPFIESVEVIQEEASQYGDLPGLRKYSNSDNNYFFFGRWGSPFSAPANSTSLVINFHKPMCVEKIRLRTAELGFWRSLDTYIYTEAVHTTRPDRYFGRLPKNDSETDTVFIQREIEINEETRYVEFYCGSLKQQNSALIDDIEIFFCVLDSTNTQSDVSDDLWAIVKPELALDEVDMGWLFPHQIRDSLVAACLRNTGTGPARINNIYISNDPDGNFEILSGGGAFTLEGGDSRPVEFRFKPQTPGLKEGMVNIDLGNDTLSARIFGMCIDSAVTLATGFIDFEKVHVGSQRDSIIFLIKNISESEANIEATELLGPDREQFEIVEGGGPFVLAPGEERRMKLRFAPERIGRTSGMLGFREQSLTDPLTAQLFGEGIIEPGGSAVLQAGSASAAAGEFVEIPIYLKNADARIFAYANAINTDLTFNSTLLYPVDYRNSPVNNGLRTIHLENLPLPSDENGEIGRVRFRAALGNARTTELRFGNYEAVGGPVELDTISGEFTLTGICEDGGARLINISDKETAIGAVSPNPASGSIDIDITTLEDGRHEIEIIDIFGSPLRVVHSGELSAGDYEFTISTSEFSSGIYYIIMKTPSIIKTQKLEIVR